MSLMVYTTHITDVNITGSGSGYWVPIPMAWVQQAGIRHVEN